MSTELGRGVTGDSNRRADERIREREKGFKTCMERESNKDEEGTEICTYIV